MWPALASLVVLADSVQRREIKDKRRTVENGASLKS
jgi:hypothetical protein